MIPAGYVASLVAWAEDNSPAFRARGAVTFGSPTVTTGSCATQQLVPGLVAFSPAFPAGTTITAIDTGAGTVTLSQNATLNGPVDLVFYMATAAGRVAQLLDARDALVTGQLTAKPTRTLVSGALNGKTFSWLPDLTAAEKLTIITGVLRILGVLGRERSSVTYGNFTGITR